MKVKLLSLMFIGSFVAMIGWAPFNYQQMNQVPGSEKWIDKEVLAIAAQAPDMNKKVLELGLTAYQNARQKGLVTEDLLTIVDYSKPSNERRLWVVNVKTDQVLFDIYVAHGKNSGELNSTSFSNDPNSLKSSMGVFIANETYTGGKGYSLKLQGLEPGVNDNVNRRHVIFHGAAYVSDAYLKAKGMMGRSWGCMAVDFNVVKPLINTIKNKTLVFAYYPDQKWLHDSQFLK
jgi:hypothetical protein